MSMINKRLQRLALLFMVGAAGAYVVFWQTQKSERHDKTKAADEKLFACEDSKSVVQMRLVTPRGEFVITRGATATATAAAAPAPAPDAGQNQWRLQKPLDTPAEASTVDAIIEQLVQLRRTRLVGTRTSNDEDAAVTPPADLSLFALAPPAYRVELTQRASDGAQTRETLLVGKKNSFDGSVYVKREGQDSVALVAGTLLYQIDKDLFSLRDKRVARFDAEDVAAITLSLPRRGSVYEIKREGDGFRFVKPKPVAADTSQVDGMLSALSNLRASSFVAETPPSAGHPDWARWGLDAPVARVEITLGAVDPNPERRSPERATQVLLLGRAGGGGGDSSHVYARLESGGPIIELGNDWGLRKVDVGFDDLRDKHVLAFERDDVAAISLTQGTTTVLSCEKRASDAETTGDAWFMTAPEQTRAQASMISGLLYKLWSMTAARIVTDTPSPQQLQNVENVEQGASDTAADVIRIALRRKGGELIGSIAFGQVEGNQQYATSSGTGRLDLVEKRLVDEIDRNPSAYKESSESNQ